MALMLAALLQVTGAWPHVAVNGQADLQRLTAPAASKRAPVQRFILPVATDTQSFVAPQAQASYLAIDRATARPLVSYQADKLRPVASITKVVTAIVILSRHKPDDVVTVGQLPDYAYDADTMGLRQGETYRVADLIRAALVPSANDAADALAIYDAGSIPAFAQRMNDKLQDWGITGAHFSNPSGLNEEGNQASATALAKIASLALTQPDIRAAVAMTQITVVSGSGRSFSLRTTNDLLAESGFRGIKTGYTGAAGQCFLGLTQVDGHDIITVVLGSEDRFGETRSLINWIGQHWLWLET